MLHVTCYDSYYVKAPSKSFIFDDKCFKESLRTYLYNFLIVSQTSAQFDGETPFQEEVSLTCTFGENINEKRQQFRILDDQSGSH